MTHNAKTKIPLYYFTGNNRIDVPARSQRDYRAVFYSYAESHFYFKATFTTEDKEYQFYEVEYEVTEPEVLETIKLTTSVRSQVCHALKLENPLESSIMYTAKCDDPFVFIRDMPKTVLPLSHEFVDVQYYPMLPSETIAILEVNCHELGRFLYELRLKASPALPEKVTRVSATLGTTSTFPLPVKNCTEQRTEFTIQVDNDCFASPRIIVVPEFHVGMIEVVYEPCDVETVAATLTASSKIAGDFV
ncbi:hydrocephalus-inducing protein homolog, partial [Hylaeus volcanicus]|uniref:hydrocephalus-inducing protein homolog n=1 Tax=Hylaeus volcanicus TaxID=313075 RepID=UPI0023B8452B